MPIFLKEDATYDDFLQEAIDRDKVKHILENRKFTEDCFATETFEETDAIRMIAKYNAIGIKETVSYSSRFLSLCDYPLEAKQKLSVLFRKYKLLCPDINSEDLILLLTTGMPSCKYMIPACTRNVDLGLVLNMLSSVGAFGRNWSSAICSPGMLLTASGIKMQGKNLSAAVHKFDNYKLAQLDSKQKEIERDVKRILEGIPEVANRL